MCITTISGGRNTNDDIIILYNEKPINIYQIAKILILLWDNEDRKNPPPREGAKYTKRFIDELFEQRKLTDELLAKYKISKKSQTA